MKLLKNVALNQFYNFPCSRCQFIYIKHPTIFSMKRNTFRKVTDLDHYHSDSQDSISSVRSLPLCR